MDDEEFGTTADYLRAFEVVQGEGIADHHIALLRAHLSASGYATTWERLARDIGYPTGSSVNLQYGKFAERIARQLGLTDKPLDPNGAAWCLWVLVRWASQRDPESGHTAFVLRRPVIEAAARLGIGPGAGVEVGPGGHALSADEADQSDSYAAEGYSPASVDRRPLVERQIRERPGQSEFRDALRQRYGDRCLVTGCKVLAVLEAAHINPYRGEQDNHPENGLLLRSDIHTLFDLDLVGIEPEQLQVELCPEVTHEYGSFAGMALDCPANCRPSLEALRLRYQQFRRNLGR